MFDRVKITVVEKKLDKKVINQFLNKPEKMRICSEVEVGQEFITDSPFEIPPGFCASAWADIRPFIMTIASGGSFKFFKDEKVGVAICCDPFRPVTFKIERI